MSASLLRQDIGVVYKSPGVVLLDSNDSEELVFSAGYLNDISSATAVALKETDFVRVSYGDTPTLAFCRIDFGPAGIMTLVDIAGTGPNKNGAEPNVITASKTIEMSDCGTRLIYNGTDPGTITLPATTAVPLPLGATIDFTQINTGALIFAAGSGATIVSAQGALIEASGQYSTCQAYKYTDAIWVVSGDITSQA